MEESATLTVAYAIKNIWEMNMHYLRPVSIVTSLMTLLLSIGYANSAELVGKVIGVSDGDTITLLVDSKQYKIRLSGIDAPEKDQAFGTKSKQSLSDCAFGQQAVIRYDKQDKYGRTVGKVLVGNVDCNLRQLDQGLAWHYKRYAAEQPEADKATYSDAESGARKSKLGLWVDVDPVPPWEWRKLKYRN